MDLAESVDDGTVDRDQASRIVNVVESRRYHPLVISTEAFLLYEGLDFHHCDGGDKSAVRCLLLGKFFHFWRLASLMSFAETEIPQLAGIPWILGKGNFGVASSRRRVAWP